MCPARRRGSFPGRQTTRRASSWEEGPGQVGAQTTISSSIASITSSIVLALTDGLTVVRIRGRFHAWLKTAANAAEGFSGAFGIGITTAAALAAGAGSVPTPITEQAWEGWLYWTPIQLIAPIGPLTAAQTTASGMIGQLGTQIMEVDTKAMRKIGEDMAIYAAIEVTEVGTASMDYRFDSRMLVKLP